MFSNISHRVTQVFVYPLRRTLPYVWTKWMYYVLSALCCCLAIDCQRKSSNAETSP